MQGQMCGCCQEKHHLLTSRLLNERPQLFAQAVICPNVQTDELAPALALDELKKWPDEVMISPIRRVNLNC